MGFKINLIKTVKTLSLIAAAAIIPLATGCVKTEVRLPDKNGHKIVWHDEFDGKSLDSSKWGYQTGTRDYYGNTVGAQYWGNDEMQYYTEGENLTVSDGILTITAKREIRGDRQFTSSRIVTRDKFSQTYGYFEARIKLPVYDGMWPAFWLLPQPSDGTSSDNEYGGWATNGELDIMEAKGRLPDRIGTALHFGGKYPQNTYKSNTAVLETPIDEWHVYAVDWRAEYIAWFVDEEEVFRLKNTEWWSAASEEPTAPFDKPFYILLNLAVGGKYDGYVAPDENFMQASMCVDYVRVYE